MVHVILVVRLARGNNAKLPVRLRRWQKAHLARRVTRDHEQKKGAASGALNLDAKALVRLFTNQSVRLPRASRMTVEPMRAFSSWIFDGVEKRPIVRRPGRARDSLNRLRENRAIPQIPDVQRVLPESGGIQRISEKLVVIANVKSAKP
jgi:hypothetical protein